MGHAGRELVSEPALFTGLVKFGGSLFLLLFGLFWAGIVIYGSCTTGSPPVWVGIGLALLWLGSTGFHILAHLLPLKVVWLEDEGVRLFNFESELILPYEAIARIEERRGSYRLVAVRLDRTSYFGQRFTFLSAARLGPWPQFSLPKDEGVTEFRRRVAAARAGLKWSPALRGPATRSIMADDELDGPF